MWRMHIDNSVGSNTFYKKHNIWSTVDVQKKWQNL